jgi:thiosulfate/3-mercaptopyruvate sulfurtransferase
LRVVDLRWRADGSGRDVYAAAHIPGAVHLDWHADLNGGGSEDNLLPPDRFAALMEASGIGDDTAVVGYAETDHSGAARLWWALRYYGHDQVAVLNGGLDKWQAEGRPLASYSSSYASSSRFTPRVQPRWLATAAEIDAALASPDSPVQLVDTRPAEQYAGLAVWTPEGSRYLPPGQRWIEVDGVALQPGRIPGAIHWHAARNLASDWTYRSPAELRDMAEAAGIRLDHPGERVILYCGVGISASLGLFALHLAGHRNLALYDASWREWGSDPLRPVERDP